MNDPLKGSFTKDGQTLRIIPVFCKVLKPDGSYASKSLGIVDVAVLDESGELVPMKPDKPVARLVADRLDYPNTAFVEDDLKLRPNGAKAIYSGLGDTGDAGEPNFAFQITLTQSDPTAAVRVSAAAEMLAG